METNNVHVERGHQMVERLRGGVRMPGQGVCEGILFTLDVLDLLDVVLQEDGVPARLQRGHLGLFREPL
jgi:hypothetical protein